MKRPAAATASKKKPAKAPSHKPATAKGCKKKPGEGKGWQKSASFGWIKQTRASKKHTFKQSLEKAKTRPIAW